MTRWRSGSISALAALADPTEDGAGFLERAIQQLPAIAGRGSLELLGGALQPGDQVGVLGAGLLFRLATTGRGRFEGGGEALAQLDQRLQLTTRIGGAEIRLEGSGALGVAQAALGLDAERGQTFFCGRLGRRRRDRPRGDLGQPGRFRGGLGGGCSLGSFLRGDFLGGRFLLGDQLGLRLGDQEGLGLHAAALFVLVRLGARGVERERGGEAVGEVFLGARPVDVVPLLAQVGHLGGCGVAAGGVLGGHAQRELLRLAHLVDRGGHAARDLGRLRVGHRRHRGGQPIAGGRAHGLVAGVLGDLGERGVAAHAGQGGESDPLLLGRGGDLDHRRLADEAAERGGAHLVVLGADGEVDEQLGIGDAGDGGPADLGALRATGDAGHLALRVEEGEGGERPRRRPVSQRLGEQELGGALDGSLAQRGRLERLSQLEQLARVVQLLQGHPADVLILVGADDLDQHPVVAGLEVADRAEAGLGVAVFPGRSEQIAKAHVSPARNLAGVGPRKKRQIAPTAGIAHGWGCGWTGGGAACCSARSSSA